MVVIDQLRITDDGKQMIINAHINEAEYFNDVYFDNVTIMTADKVSENDPGTPTTDYIYKQVFEAETKSIAVVIDKGSLDAAYLNTNHTTGEPVTDAPTAMVSFSHSNFSQDLFFIYFQCNGYPSECTPCHLAERTTVAVIFDETMFYQLVMNYTRELASDCQIPQGFIDFILLWNAFKAAVETEHWIPAIKFYDMMFGARGSNSGAGYIVSKPCRCHG